MVKSASVKGGSAGPDCAAPVLPPATAEHFRAIAELHGDVCFVLDCASGVPVYVSPSLITLLGIDADALLHPPGEADQGDALAILYAGLPERLHRFAEGDLSRLRVVRQVEQRRSDGALVPLEVVSTLLTDDTGKPTVLAGMLRDISAERERVAQQRRFTSMLNHEFRTPLSTIDGAVQRLEATGAQADDATRLRYRKIQTAVDRLIVMLDDYLSPDRLDEIGRTRQADSVDPAHLLEEAAERVRAAGRQVSVDGGDLPASLRCQPQGLRLALQVLVDNALQYAPGGDVIALSGGSANGGIVLAVGDHGAGVPPADSTRIFDKGYRGSNASGPGAGRGLYMARAVVEVHGGQLSVENNVPSGAVFRIWLPPQRGTGKSVASAGSSSDNSANQHTREGAAQRK